MRPAFPAILALIAGMLGVAAGCGGTSIGPPPSEHASGPIPTPSPAAKRLYVDHDGTLYVYALPLAAGAKPLRTLAEAPDAAVPPQVAVDIYGRVAIATPTQIRLYPRTFRSFAPSAAMLTIPLTPAVTEIGRNGADLVDIEFDPNDNLWLLNNLGGEVSELQAPLSAQSVASTTLEFGAPGSKTASYGFLVEARFDVNATLYVYATQSQGQHSLVFESRFPYAKPPSSLGINLAHAGFIDSSQYAPTSPTQLSLLLGQYNGPLASPPPQQPPPPPVNELAQFSLPLMPALGLFPDATTNTIVSALVPDPLRDAFYVLKTANGELDAYALPLRRNARPALSLPCPGNANLCNDKSEHLFLSP